MLTEMDLESLIYGGLIAIVGAVSGGFISYHFQKRIAKDNEERLLNSFVKSIKTEISMVWDIYEEMGNIVENLPENEGLSFYYPIVDNYFVVYDNNTNLIGALDEECATLIVKTYTIAKGLKDSYICNNYTLQKIDSYKESFQVNQNEYTNQQYRELLKNWQAYGNQIKHSHFKLKEQKEKLIHYIDLNFK